MEALCFKGEGVLRIWADAACRNEGVHENLGILLGDSSSLQGEREGRCLGGLGVSDSPSNALLRDATRAGGPVGSCSCACSSADDVEEEEEVVREDS